MNPIVEKMEQAIAECRQSQRDNKRKVQEYAIEKVSNRIEEITDEMIAIMRNSNSLNAISGAYLIEDFFDIERAKVGEFMSVLFLNFNNVFAEYLIENNLTMIRDTNTRTKIRFSYGKNTNWSVLWEFVCGAWGEPSEEEE